MDLSAYLKNLYYEDGDSYPHNCKDGWMRRKLGPVCETGWLYQCKTSSIST